MRVLRVVLLPLLLHVPASPAQERAAQEEEPRFNVWEYAVLGNTTLPAQSIERAVYPFLGGDKTFADVESARQSLEQAYRALGFATVFVDIPEQPVDDGTVRLQVTEGRLDRVRVTGARYFSNGRIRAALPAVTPGRVPNVPVIQDQLADFNRSNPDRSVVPVLKAGRTPGTVDIELKVEDEMPLHGRLELNDRYTADTSRLRLDASLSYDNLFQRGHSLSLQYQTAPEERADVEVMVLSYVLRMPHWRRTTFALYAVDSNTDVAALGTLSVIGQGRIFGLRGIHSLPDGNDYFHSVSFGFDYKDFLENIRLEDEDLLTPIRYLNWSLAYNGTARRARTTNAFDLGVGFGVRGLFNDPQEFEDKRFRGAANYFYVSGGVQHLRTLPWDLQFAARLSGQFTQSALVSNEQFSIGGADTVRGYRESSQLGDYGFNGTLELRHTALSRWLQLPPGGAYLLAFYDAGVVSIIDPLPSQTARFDLASWGLGIRVGGWHGVALALDWAHVFTPSGEVDAGDERAHFSFRYAF